jgi:hypothetical protein
VDIIHTYLCNTNHEYVIGIRESKLRKVNCVARDTVSRVVKALSIELPEKTLTLSARALFSTKFEKDKSTMNLRVHKILSDFHVDQLGSCFMVIVTVDMVSIVMEVVSFTFDLWNFKYIYRSIVIQKLINFK